MSFGAALLAMSAVSAITSIGQGYVKRSEANYAATVSDEQAKSIDVAKGIEYGQYQRLKGKYLSKSVAAIGGSGIGLGGSALAVALDTQTQINIDQAIGQFNYEQEKLYKKNEANAYRRQGRSALSSSYTNAFSTMLMGGSQYAYYKGWLNTDSGAKTAGKL